MRPGSYTLRLSGGLRGVNSESKVPESKAPDWRRAAGMNGTEADIVEHQFLRRFLLEVAWRCPPMGRWPMLVSNGPLALWVAAQASATARHQTSLVAAATGSAGGREGRF
jgi:hypothetical protein